MTLTLSISTPEGIVLAADSRQSYRNTANVSRIGSDSATKIYSVNKNVGITVAGPAFLQDPSDSDKNPKSIGYFINAFLRTMSKDETVQTITEKLQTYLDRIYQPEKKLAEIVDQGEKQITKIGGTVVKKENPNPSIVVIHFTDKDGQSQTMVAELLPISLIIAGYDEEKKGKPELQVNMLYVPGPLQQKRLHGEPSQYGASWTGQLDVINRIVLGFDPRIANLSFVQGVASKIGPEQLNSQLSLLEYNINWGTMTLSDAVDFAKLMIETTSAIQRFSDGIRIAPGEMPGVGGPIDIAIIDPYRGFQWHQKKSFNLIESER